jgi:hypothetical protein
MLTCQHVDPALVAPVSQAKQRLFRRQRLWEARLVHDRALLLAARPRDLPRCIHVDSLGSDVVQALSQDPFVAKSAADSLMESLGGCDPTVSRETTRTLHRTAVSHPDLPQQYFEVLREVGVSTTSSASCQDHSEHGALDDDCKEIDVQLEEDLADLQCFSRSATVGSPRGSPRLDAGCVENAFLLNGASSTSSCAAFNERCRPCLDNGTVVRIVKLFDAKRLNGKIGTIIAYERLRERYAVKAFDDDHILAVKNINLQLIEVGILTLLSQRPELCGEAVFVYEYDPKSGRILVEVLCSAERLRVRPSSLTFQEDVIDDKLNQYFEQFP